MRVAGSLPYLYGRERSRTRAAGAMGGRRSGSRLAATLRRGVYDEMDDYYTAEDMSGYDRSLDVDDDGGARELDSGASSQRGVEGGSVHFVKASRPQPSDATHEPPAVPSSFVERCIHVARWTHARAS